LNSAASPGSISPHEIVEHQIENTNRPTIATARRSRRRVAATASREASGAAPILRPRYSSAGRIANRGTAGMSPHCAALLRASRGPRTK
jgi:hypothetical protein